MKSQKKDDLEKLKKTLNGRTFAQWLKDSQSKEYTEHIAWSDNKNCTSLIMLFLTGIKINCTGSKVDDQFVILTDKKGLKEINTMMSKPIDEFFKYLQMRISSMNLSEN